MEFAAKILNNDQRVWVQDNYHVFTPRTVPDARYPASEIQTVIDAAIRLQYSPDFVAWLPEARALQLGFIRTHKTRLSGAEALLIMLQSSDNP